MADPINPTSSMNTNLAEVAKLLALKKTMRAKTAVTLSLISGITPAAEAIGTRVRREPGGGTAEAPSPQGPVGSTVDTLA